MTSLRYGLCVAALSLSACAGLLNGGGFDIYQAAYGGQRVSVQNALAIPVCGVDEVASGGGQKARLVLGPNVGSLSPGGSANAYLPTVAAGTTTVDLRFRGCDVSGMPTGVVATVASLSVAELPQHDNPESPIVVH